MNGTLVSTYQSPTVGISAYQIFITNFFAIIPNIYFFYRSLTYEAFNERKMFKYMTMVMSFEYIIACLAHLIYYGYLFIHYFTDSKIHTTFCSKMNTVHININQLLIVTPFYFNIYRYYKIVYYKNPSIFVVIVAIIITLGSLIYTMGGQFFEIKPYYLPKNGCGQELLSDIPFFHLILRINIVIALILPCISLLINYKIYKTVMDKKNSLNKKKFDDKRNLLNAITIQSAFPLLCHVPGILYLLYFYTTRHNPIEFVILANFLYYTGQGFCIFLSIIVIDEFKKMILNDIGLLRNASLNSVATEEFL